MRAWPDDRADQADQGVPQRRGAVVTITRPCRSPLPSWLQRPRPWWPRGPRQCTCIRVPQLDELGVAVPRLLHGEDAACWPLVARAAKLGLPARIGPEDTTVGPDGASVSGNAELIRVALGMRAAAAPG